MELSNTVEGIKQFGVFRRIKRSIWTYIIQFQLRKKGINSDLVLVQSIVTDNLKAYIQGRFISIRLK